MRATTTTLHALALAALALPLGLPLAAQEAAPDATAGATEDAPPADAATPALDAAATPAAPEAPVEAAPAGTGTEAAPEAATTDAADTPAQGAEGTAPDAGLSLGEPVDGAAGAEAASGEPQPGQPFIRETFGDWSQRCLQAEEGQPDPCQLYQLLSDDQGNAVAEISMFPLPAGGEAVAGATIVTPLETLLTEDLTLSVDGAATRRYPFTFCNAAGCVARVGFTAEEIQQFKNGNQATIRLVPAAAPDQEVVLTISLAGFTAGFDAQQTPPAE